MPPHRLGLLNLATSKCIRMSLLLLWQIILYVEGWVGGVIAIWDVGFTHHIWVVGEKGSIHLDNGKGLVLILSYRPTP